MIKVRVSLKEICIAAFVLFASSSAWGQCAPGIPSAGNPGCIPSDQANSPYYQGQSAPAYAPRIKWADKWGAIAVDEATGTAGTVSASANKGKAEGQALARCAENGGKGCKLIFTYHNQCVAVTQAIRGGGMFAVSAPDEPTASRLALEDCGKDCHVLYSRCSLPERIE